MEVRASFFYDDPKYTSTAQMQQAQPLWALGAPRDYGASPQYRYIKGS